MLLYVIPQRKHGCATHSQHMRSCNQHIDNQTIKSHGPQQMTVAPPPTAPYSSFCISCSLSSMTLLLVSCISPPRYTSSSMV